MCIYNSYALETICMFVCHDVKTLKTEEINLLDLLDQNHD